MPLVFINFCKFCNSAIFSPTSLDFHSSLVVFLYFYKHWLFCHKLNGILSWEAILPSDICDWAILMTYLTVIFSCF